MAITYPAYQAEAVFQPGTGGVFYNDVGAEPPTLAEVRTWVEGDRSQSIGTGEAAWSPIGYTSIDDLPGITAETEGGEKKGVWENPDFRLTPITTTDAIGVKPVQWSPVPLSHRFGAGVTVDGERGLVAVPNIYTPVEVSIMVVILDGNNPLVLHYYRTATSPDGDLELDRENFAALPVKYTVLGLQGQPNKMNILGYHLQTLDVDDDGIPDAIDDDTTGV
jgi:hypothetical protein